MDVRGRFERALAGVNFQAIPFHHPVLHAYAQNVDGSPALLVRVDANFKRDVEGTRGIGVHLDPADSANRCIRFQSEEQGISVMFEAVIESLLEASDAGDDHAEALDLLLDSYEDLRQMFAARRGQLTESAVRGLFAELSMILELRDADYTQTQITNAWQGPYRTAKDFLLPGGRSLEIKSIRRVNHHVRIANLDQLDNRNEDLRLAVLPIDRCAPNEGRGLMDLFGEVVSWINVDPAARSPFLNACAALGMDPSDSYYRQWYFDSGRWSWFEINDEFPRIRPEDAPSAISNVTFTLDIDRITEFASRPFWS